MDRPRWDRLEDWGRGEASRYLAEGLDPHPTLAFFEGDEPTLYTRAGAIYATAGARSDDLRWRQLFGMGMVIHPERAVLMSTGRLRTDDDGALLGEAEGEAAVFVSWARRREGAAPEQGGVVLAYGLDDTGAVRWGERFELPDGGPPGRYLAATVTGRWSDDGPDEDPVEMSAAELAYAMSRYGFALGVDPDWRQRYGLDQPIAARGVRPEDRARAKRLPRRHPTEVRS